MAGKQSAFMPCLQGTLRNGPCPWSSLTGRGRWTHCGQNTEAPAGDRAGAQEQTAGARTLCAEAPGPQESRGLVPERHASPTPPGHPMVIRPPPRWLKPYTSAGQGELLRAVQ